MTTTLDQLVTLAQRELGVDSLAGQTMTPFAEMGMDSLSLVDFMFTVEDHFQVSIEHDQALRHPTLVGLAGLIDGLLAEMPAAAAA